MTGRGGKAVSDAARTVALLQAEIGSQSESSLIGLASLSLGRARLAEGKTDAALTAFRAAFNHLNHALGSEHPDTQIARRSIEQLTASR